jgi:hypothetical protein
MTTWTSAFASVTMAALLAAAPPVPAAELILNGGFETGDVTGWTVTDQPSSSGTFVVDDADGFTPLSAQVTAGPAAGSFYAVADQTGAGAHVLLQGFTVPGGSSVIVSFDMFVNDWSDAGPIVNPAGLDHTAGPNQHARVDILTAAAGPFDTGAGVLAPLYLGVDGGADPNAFTSYGFDLTGLLGGGGSFQIRFAAVETEFFLNQGVDNVSVVATLPGGVPAPPALALLGLGLAVACARRGVRSTT